MDQISSLMPPNLTICRAVGDSYNSYTILFGALEKKEEKRCIAAYIYYICRLIFGRTPHTCIIRPQVDEPRDKVEFTANLHERKLQVQNYWRGQKLSQE